MKSKFEEIGKLSEKELELKGKELRDTLLGLKLRNTTGRMEQSHRVSALRKDIARVETAKSALRLTAAK